MAPAVVHLVGTVTATAPVTDPAFGLTTDALRLDRTAETYQWLETRESSGDNKLLRYEKIWSPVLIPSDRFEQRSFHANPRALRLTTARFRHRRRHDRPRRHRPGADRRPAGDPRAAPGAGWPGPRRGPRVRPQRRLAVQRRSRHAGGGRCPRAVRRSAGGRDLARGCAQRRPAGPVSVSRRRQRHARRLRRGSGRDAARVRRRQWREAWQLRGFAAMAVLIGTLFAMPELPCVLPPARCSLPGDACAPCCCWRRALPPSFAPSAGWARGC